MGLIDDERCFAIDFNGDGRIDDQECLISDDYLQRLEEEEDDDEDSDYAEEERRQRYEDFLDENGLDEDDIDIDEWEDEYDD